MKWVLLSLAWAGIASAQIVVTPISPTSTPTEQTTEQTKTPTAAQLLAQAQAAAEKARNEGALPTPDQPLWREAVDLGEAARAADPENLTSLRFLAEIYSTLSWNGRAWDVWNAYLAVGGELDAPALKAVSEAGRELGYARYTAGNLSDAAEVFKKVSELEPQNVEALTWLGRIALEQGQSKKAETYWQRVLTLKPGDQTARYYLAQSQQQLKFGADSTGAFNEGLVAYNAGQKAAALDAFTRAADANPDFEEAATWGGRVALELGRPRVAKRFWQALLERKPDDQTVTYYLTLAEAQETWGAAAGRAFYAGQDLYNRGEVRDAAERFTKASDANPEYPAAASWAARSLQESGQAARAVPYWERVVSLNPDDKSAQYFLETARSQQAISEGATRAFDAGVRAYEEADLGAARRAFETATKEAPNYADAWGWLGRLAFESGSYGEAASAYGRALGLEPDNTTYRFFAAEAKRLGAQ